MSDEDHIRQNMQHIQHGIMQYIDCETFVEFDFVLLAYLCRPVELHQNRRLTRNMTAGEEWDR